MAGYPEGDTHKVNLIFLYLFVKKPHTLKTFSITCVDKKQVVYLFLAKECD